MAHSPYPGMACTHICSQTDSLTYCACMLRTVPCSAHPIQSNATPLSLSLSPSPPQWLLLHSLSVCVSRTTEEETQEHHTYCTQSSALARPLWARDAIYVVAWHDHWLMGRAATSDATGDRASERTNNDNEQNTACNQSINQPHIPTFTGPCIHPSIDG